MCRKLTPRHLRAATPSSARPTSPRATRGAPLGHLPPLDSGTLWVDRAQDWPQVSTHHHWLRGAAPGGTATGGSRLDETADPYHGVRPSGKAVRTARFEGRGVRGQGSGVRGGCGLAPARSSCKTHGARGGFARAGAGGFAGAAAEGFAGAGAGGFAGAELTPVPLIPPATDH
jgi:hypothetical protein